MYWLFLNTWNVFRKLISSEQPTYSPLHSICWRADFYQTAEFASFHGISTFSRNFAELVLANDKETNTAYFRRVQAVGDNYLLNVDMIAPSNTWLPRAVTGGILNMLSWACLKYCPFTWQTDCISQLQLPATNTAYFVGFRRPYKVNYYMWNWWAMVSRGIWQNLSADFGKICRGKLWSLSITYDSHIGLTYAVRKKQKKSSWIIHQLNKQNTVSIMWL